MFDQNQFRETVIENICTKKQDIGYEQPWIFLQQADPDKKSLLCLHKTDRKARPIRPLMNCASYAAA